jgi:hypothetical protein
MYNDSQYDHSELDRDMQEGSYHQSVMGSQFDHHDRQDTDDMMAA